MKQVILIRQDLKLSKGKLAVQVAHASVEATLKSSKLKVKKWKEEGMKKVVLKVKDKSELFKYKKLSSDAGLINAVIKDAGKTEVKPGTVTCMAVGPDKEESIDYVTDKLKML
jgi:PTH2 family peptidyl-tRNA hydrolase|tara:strand:- start:702 stop:1040 length:339 start_codon:yes stop_codon:yes gene_type:complete